MIKRLFCGHNLTKWFVVLIFLVSVMHLIFTNMHIFQSTTLKVIQPKVGRRPPPDIAQTPRGPAPYRGPQWILRMRRGNSSAGQTKASNSSSSGGGGSSWKYFLTEALQVRIYQTDKARWTLAELKQWMHYMFWAGVEHIYLCDHYTYTDERLDVPLKEYIDLGLVTYMAWNDIKKAITAQVACYQHIIDITRRTSRWQIAVDMDEYPFVMADQEEGFLIRYLEKVAPEVSEVSMGNFLMLGQGDRKRTTVIERITRMTPVPPNGLDKPIYKPLYVRAAIHHNGLKAGTRRLEANRTVLRMLHYWGARMQNWGPDTNKTLSMTVPFTRARDKLGPAVRQSLLEFGERNVFNSSTGP